MKKSTKTKAKSKAKTAKPKATKRGAAKKPAAAKRAVAKGKKAAGSTKGTTRATGKRAAPTKTRSKAPAKAPRVVAAPLPEPRAARAKPEPDAGLLHVTKALELALERKARDPVLLDVQDLCSYCNYQLVLSAQSDRQVEAIADAIAIGLRADDRRPMGREGHRSAQWALLDYGDFIVHIFHRDVREHYDLEGLWSDARRVPIDVPAEAHSSVDDLYA